MANSKSSRHRARPGVRTDRLEHLMCEELNFLFSTEIGDPYLTDVHVERVHLADNAAMATVFVRSTNTSTSAPHPLTTLSQLQPELQHALNRAAAFLRRRVLDALPLKRSPELRFKPGLPHEPTPEETL